MIYSASAKKGYKMPGVYDKDSKRFIGMLYRPHQWEANKIYYLRGTDDYDVVIPAEFNGLYYKVISPGKSGDTEPTWGTKVGSRTTSGTVIFEAVAYNLMPASETIAESSWTASDGVTLANETNSGTYTAVMIDSVPDDIESFSITNHTVRSNGEEHDATIRFKVGVR
jgi:hypothetical protein